MRLGHPSIALILLAAQAASSCQIGGEYELQVAVSSNFADAATRIADRFEEKTGRKVSLSFGSSGKHFTQIRNGAPFDLFLSADTLRPALLEQEGLAVYGSRHTYAVGKLVLWSPTIGYVDSEGRVLSDGAFRFLAIAHPDLAPYGRAAREVLQAKGLWEDLSDRIVRGENISQAYHFVTSGNAELGFVAASQVIRPGKQFQGSLWAVPDSLYTPIEQQVVLLRDVEAARDFLEFVKSEEAVQIIHDFGYDTP